MGKTNFIKTSDKETANKLIANGYTLLTYDGGTYTFANDANNKYAKEVSSKVVFTNAIAM